MGAEFLLIEDSSFWVWSVVLVYELIGCVLFTVIFAHSRFLPQKPSLDYVKAELDTKVSPPFFIFVTEQRR